MSEVIDEVLQDEQSRLAKELKDLEKELNKGVPLSHDSEKLVLNLLKHALNARMRDFSSESTREHLEGLKDLFTYRLKIYEERKNKRYEQARNMLIPDAEAYADEKVAERDEEWSRYFFERMDQLASDKLSDKKHLWIKNSWE